MIIDYSTSRPSISQLKAANVTSVGRYIGWDSVPGYPSIGKNITKTEANSLISAGISIFLAFEYAPDAAARGLSQGTVDGHLAMKQLAALDAPPTMAVYFAIDYDIPDYDPGLSDTPANAVAKLGPVAKYFQAINALKCPYKVGVYGGFYAVKRVMDAKLATLAWQATAWSGGNIDSRAVLYQTTRSAPIPGADVDIRLLPMVADFGQWPRPSIPVPDPKPITKKENKMLHYKVTAPSGHSWGGTRTFLYEIGHDPVWIEDQQSETGIEAVNQVAVISWNQHVAFGGS